MKAWITEDALVGGIYKVKGTYLGAECTYSFEDRAGSIYAGEGNEWHRTKAAAIVRAKEMRDEEVDRLVARMDALISLTFG